MNESFRFNIHNFKGLLFNEAFLFFNLCNLDIIYLKFSITYIKEDYYATKT